MEMNYPLFSIKAEDCNCRLEIEVKQIWSKNGLIVWPQLEIASPTIEPCEEHSRENWKKEL